MSRPAHHQGNRAPTIPWAASSVGWNFLGLALPVAVAIVLIPGLLGHLGSERFGILALAWGMLSLFEVLDFGVCRSIAQGVAFEYGSGNSGKAYSLYLAGERLARRRGTLGGLGFAAAMLCGGYSLIPANSISDRELLTASLILALAGPLQTLVVSRRSATEGFLDFRAVNLARMIGASLDVVAPWLVSRISERMDLIICSLILSRLITALMLGIMIRIGRHDLPRKLIDDIDLRRYALDGRSISVSTILAPIFLHADRLIVGVLISASAVGSYAVAADTIKRVSSLTSAVTSVIFAKLSSMAHNDQGEKQRFFWSTLRAMIVISSVILAGLAWMIPTLAQAWIGKESQDILISIEVGQWICLGLWFRTFSAMNFAWLHAHRDFSRVASAQAIQVLPFLLLAVVLVVILGPAGAAIAWVAREGTDACMLHVLVTRSMRSESAHLTKGRSD